MQYYYIQSTAAWNHQTKPERKSKGKEAGWKLANLSMFTRHWAMGNQAQLPRLPYHDVFSKIFLIISFPSRTASGKRGAKYS
jgi:predicted DNA-binding ArsR family transcriptional regulator